MGLLDSDPLLEVGGTIGNAINDSFTTRKKSSDFVKHFPKNSISHGKYKTVGNFAINSFYPKIISRIVVYFSIV